MDAAHPLAASVIEFLVSLMLPLEIVGLPGPPTGGIRGAVDRLADVRMVPQFIPAGIQRNNLVGYGLNDVVARFLRGAEREVTFLPNGTRLPAGAPSPLNTHRVDFFWRDTFVEVKSGALDIEQLEYFLQRADQGNFRIVYIVLNNAEAALQVILSARQRTNTQNVPVRVISFGN